MPGQAHRGVGGIASTHSESDTRRLVVSSTLRLAYPQEKPGSHRTGSWLGPRPGLDGTQNLAPTGIQTPARPARSVVAIPTTLLNVYQT